MYLIGVLAHKSRNRLILGSIQHAPQQDKARASIADALPPVVASVIDTEGLEKIRKEMMNLPAIATGVHLTLRDWRNAMAVFLLVFISTFPIVIPFLFIRDPRLALRISNLIAIVMMFLCGWKVARYVGFNKWAMSTAMVLIGIILVALTIALGG